MYYQKRHPLYIKLLFLLSIIFAFFLTALPMPYWAIWFRPEWTLLVLLYWLVKTPEYVGVFTAFVIGLCLDCLYGSVLGLHSIAFVITAFAVVLSQRSLRNPGFLVQMIMILFFALIYQGCLWVIYVVLKQQVPYFWAYWAPALLCTLLWPVLSLFLDARLKLKTR